MDQTTSEVKTLSPKEYLWQEAINDIATIENGDPHGFTIDKGVKKAVIGLNALGFTTTMSCEGHADHGGGYPYIKIADREAQKQANAASDAYILQRHQDYERLNERANNLNQQLLARIDPYLTEFYDSHDVPQEVKLTAQIISRRVVLKNHGAESQRDTPIEQKVTNLAAFQKETERFGNFLETKFFSSSA